MPTSGRIATQDAGGAARSAGRRVRQQPDAGPVTLASARVALVTSAGLHERADQPFIRRTQASE